MKKYILIFTTLLFSNISHSASFDCIKASSIQEKTICNNPTISTLDEKMAGIYKGALQISTDGGNLLKTNQREWIKQAKTCPAEKIDDCLIKLYSNQTSVLQEFIVKNKGSIGAQIKEKITLKDGALGLQIGSIQEGGPAALSGLLPNDVITSLNSNQFKSELDIQNIILLKPSVPIILGILRNAQIISISVTPITIESMPFKNSENGSMNASSEVNPNILADSSSVTSAASTTSGKEEIAVNDNSKTLVNEVKPSTAKAEEDKEPEFISGFNSSSVNSISLILSALITLIILFLPRLSKSRNRKIATQDLHNSIHIEPSPKRVDHTLPDSDKIKPTQKSNRF